MTSYKQTLTPPRISISIILEDYIVFKIGFNLRTGIAIDAVVGGECKKADIKVVLALCLRWDVLGLVCI